MRSRQRGSGEKDTWKDHVRQLEDKYPVFERCRRLNEQAKFDLPLQILCWGLPLFLAAFAVVFDLRGFDRRYYFGMFAGMGIASTLFFVGRYVGIRWALQNVCVQTTHRYLDGTLHPDATFD